MRVLAIETVGTAGSVALLDEQGILDSRDLAPHERSAKSLAPTIQELLNAHAWRPRDVQLVVVAAGPGSFTGLRVGVTTAKTYAFATGAALVGVSSLAAIAWACPADVEAVWALVDAQRQQAFVARFHRAGIREALPRSDHTAHPGAAWQQARPSEIVDCVRWVAGLKDGDAVAGPLAIKLADRLPPGVRIITSAPASPHATAVGQLGWQLYQQGQRDDPFQLVPYYLRGTAAEEQWERLGRR